MGPWKRKSTTSLPVLDPFRMFILSWISAGFGFVTMEESGAKLALDKMNGYEFQGRALKVTEAQSRKPDSRRFA